ncbi:DUF7619 domain-containing protein [Flavobacterium dankookense]|uniref:Putative repeat protein (TIGR01451 family)/predicted secreted protein (Por secretion system target) n=1 Tax=Flavobacterium dankookense TaxID=706186 RepID=A0A4R6Q6C6_9FLAO|nr:T9SS type A sorting domain-containing protein [Flavobacterium dankookense]TDP57998.1 putative repeat protein (TIGR01451 family)/predicted secreted protein (Por secretion system target) [Flavobacterium dankookense]
MKKFYTILVLVFVVATNSAQIVNIPDANFKSYLVNNFDSNLDGEIQISEGLQINEIFVNSQNISSLEGINEFLNLYVLRADYNQITSLDISNLTSLVYLEITNNQLSAINLSNQDNLSELYANNNQITSLDTSNLTSLIALDLSNNQLSTINLSNQHNLFEISLSNNQINTITLPSQSLAEYCTINISNNQISSIDFSNQNNLVGLNIANNQLSNVALPLINQFDQSGLNISGNNYTSISIVPGTNLTSFICNNTQLTSLDLSNVDFNYNVPPQEVSFQINSNANLTFINLKNNFFEGCVDDSNPPIGEQPFFCSLENFSILNNPNLSAVCVDNSFNVNELNYYINYFSNSPYVSVTNYCSFTPGGTFYTIQGTTRLDNDTNDCDANDIVFPNQQFNATNGTDSGSFISNESGNYSIPVQQGTHTITPVLENPSYFTVSPASATVSFPSAASPFTQDFCVTANGVKNDVEVTIIPIEVARPGFDAEYKIIYKNKGNQVANGSLSFTFDDAIMDLVSATPVYDNGATNILGWNYTNLNPFETREIDLVFNINSPMEIPAVNGDDVLDYTATIVGATDETPNDNTFTLNQTVVNSYDPNDKTCLEGTTITPSMVGQYVHYVIRFENTGTFAAQNIVVKDMIDTTKFDIATLVPQRSSHDFITRISNTNKVEFIFENINLPFDDANNDGYVAFKIKTKPTLVLGDTFSNEASIYFDYNFPIITEPAVTTVAALSNQDFDFGSYFTLYPNPAKEVLNFEVKNEIGVKSIQVYNTLGQILLAVTNASTTTSIDVANLTAGAYFIKVTTDRGSANSKFIKE